MAGVHGKGEPSAASSVGRRNLKIKKGNFVPAADGPRSKKSYGGGFLPDDIMNEILPRLPSGIEIGRCRCVCKSWRRLLSDPVFIYNILAHSSTKEDEFAQIIIKGDVRHGNSPARPVYSLLSYKTLEPISPSDKWPDLPSVPNKVRSFSLGDDQRPCEMGIVLSIVGCCDGIVCIADKMLGKASDIILWNPTTSETRILPRSPFTGDRAGYGECIGFMVDQQTDDYKVVRRINGRGAAHVLEVHSLRQDSWRLIAEDRCGFLFTPVRYPHTYRGKMLYWWNVCPNGDLCVGSFDMGKEVLETAKFPNPTGKDDWLGHSFALLKDSIVGFFSKRMGRRRNTYLSFEVWVLLKFDDTVAWTKLFAFPRSEYVCNFPAIWKNGCYFLESGGSLSIYDPKTDETLDYGIEEDRYTAEVVAYVPSRISVSGFRLEG